MYTYEKASQSLIKMLNLNIFLNANVEEGLSQLRMDL